MGSKPRGWMLFLLFSPLVAILVIGILNFNNASAQGQGQNPEQYVIRRIDVWGLFYRLMVASIRRRFGCSGLYRICMLALQRI